MADAEQTLKKNNSELLTYMKSKINTIIMSTILNQKSIIYNEDHYLKGYQMFVNLLHNQFIEFAHSVHQILSQRKDLMSQEYLNSISNAVANRQQLNRISSVFLDVISRYKRSPDSSTFYIIVNQFLLIYENKLAYQIFEYLAAINTQSINATASNDHSFQ